MHAPVVYVPYWVVWHTSTFRRHSSAISIIAAMCPISMVYRKKVQVLATERL